jgi:PQQ-dependent dehydrogenase (methanol/ethanol family)
MAHKRDRQFQCLNDAEMQDIRKLSMRTAGPLSEGRWRRTICILLALMGVACVSTSVLFAQEPGSTISPAAAAAGKAQFGSMCVLCHGSDAGGTDRGPALTNDRQLRGLSPSEIEAIIRNGRGGMPAFPLPQSTIQTLVAFVQSLNATAFDFPPGGDSTVGEKFFFGSGHCAECHMVMGRGGVNGPDLSDVGRRFTTDDLRHSIQNPSARRTAGYAVVDVRMPDGTSLRGFARGQGTHDLQLQTFDGRLLMLREGEYASISTEPASYMAAFGGTPDELRDLVAYLARLGGVPVGPVTAPQKAVSPEAMEAISKPKRGDWSTYAGNLDGNRYSPIDQINSVNVGQLQLAWSYSIPYFGLETTPLVSDGVMYVTGPNQVYALDARTGRQIWAYTRARTTAGTIAGDAAKGANRGVAVLGERIFFVTDNAHLICLHRLTGALLWDVYMPPDKPAHYGGTSAPLVVNDLVIAGVSGADEGIRGFIAAYQATTGALVWRFWTVPAPGDPAYSTWQGNASRLGGGSTWLPGSYDAEAKVLYWPVGNPYPDTDGDERGGDNLYTDSDVALDINTGKLLWYFQFTPHDLHDWDANEPLVLVDALFGGQQRKLLLHANRNGFYYVLDRTSGKLLLATPFVKKLNWASGIGADGRPLLLPANDTSVEGVKTCPAVRGATNWYSTAFNPFTHLYYVMTVEDCTIYHKAQNGGYGRYNDPNDPAMKVLRALDMETGKVAWEAPLGGPVEANYSGVLATAGDLVFFGETSGGFAAADAKTGKFLWHFETNQPWKGSPMTYMVGGRQYVAVASGANILSFALAEK